MKKRFINWPQLAFNMTYIPAFVFIILIIFFIIGVTIDVIIPSFKTNSDQIIPILVIIVSLVFNFLGLVTRSGFNGKLSSTEIIYFSTIYLLLIIQIFAIF